MNELSAKAINELFFEQTRWPKHPKELHITKPATAQNINTRCGLCHFIHNGDCSKW